MAAHTGLSRRYAHAGAVLLGLLAAHGGVVAQTVWDGPTIVFSKADYADIGDPANQDRITDLVWITRNSFQGIFNIAQEPSYSLLSPADTEWATGAAADYENLTFQSWIQWHGQNPPSVLGVPAVVHLITEDIYIDITFTQWTMAGGGGFAYERSTAGACFEVVEEQVTCNAGGTSFTYTVQGTDSCTGGLNTYTFTGAGGAPGQEICFTLLLDGACCSVQMCTEIPDCGAVSASCDLDGDDSMGVTDLLLLLAAWGTDPGGPPDMNGDGTVDTLDVLELLDAWGPCV